MTVIKSISWILIAPFWIGSTIAWPVRWFITRNTDPKRMTVDMSQTDIQEKIRRRSRNDDRDSGHSY